MKTSGHMYDKIANMIVTSNVAYECQNIDISYAVCNTWSHCIS